jgi:hypothetical protein
LREQQAGPAARQPASVPEEEVFETPAVEDTAPEQDGVAVEAVSDAEKDNTPRLLHAKDAPTSEIATLTLAGIYAEQGFKAKALEIYRQIEARNPDLPGLRECIEAIELAFARVEREVVEELSVETDGLSGGLEIVARTTGPAEDEMGTGPVPSEPLLAIDGEPVDPVGRDESRYHRFGEWLERVRPDDGD